MAYVLYIYQRLSKYSHPLNCINLIHTQAVIQSLMTIFSLNEDVRIDSHKGRRQNSLAAASKFSSQLQPTYIANAIHCSWMLQHYGYSQQLWILMSSLIKWYQIRFFKNHNWAVCFFIFYNQKRPVCKNKYSKCIFIKVLVSHNLEKKILPLQWWNDLKKVDQQIKRESTLWKYTIYFIILSPNHSGLYVKAMVGFVRESSRFYKGAKVTLSDSNLK